MEVLKCKMCGGELELTENTSIARCKYCGSMQTLPRDTSDVRVNAYNRATHFFRNGDFDKALAIYEKILLDDPEDANAYWSCVLCKYGVTYVEDPTSHTRKITVNRTHNEPVVTDGAYKEAIRYATAEQRELFEAEAHEIDEIQRGILAISDREQPFDVFISYKESDASGNRTVDSVLATDLYYGLTDAGYKVFLSRITLEDKLGEEYEPYIYAALNSAKVMIVLGTKTEYFNAPWVKNEWSRYLHIIKDDRHKILIPAYRDIDPYDLPEEFALLQSQDMSKIGFLQDIVRGVRKVINRPVDNNSKANVNDVATRTLTATGELTKAEKIENIYKLTADNEILEVENREIEHKVFDKYINTIRLDKKECLRSLIWIFFVCTFNLVFITYLLVTALVTYDLPWTTLVYFVSIGCIVIPVISSFGSSPRIFLNRKMKTEALCSDKDMLKRQLRQDSFQPILLAFVTVGAYNFVLIRRYYKALDNAKIDDVNKKVFGGMTKAISDIKATGSCEDTALRNTYVAEYRNNYNTIKDNNDKIANLKKHLEMDE